MEFLIQDAWAQQAAQPQGSLTGFLLPLVIFIGVFYFLLIRPQQKRAKEHREMVSSISVGDEIVTGGGMLGRVVEIGELFLTVEVAEGINVKVRRDTVTAVMPKGTVKSA